MHKFEIEIKSLLGSKKKADDLVNKMRRQDPNLKILGSHKQLNHYFVGGNLKTLYDEIQRLLDDSSRAKLKDLAERAKDFSVRTREADGKVILVVKATVDDTTSSNGIARLEFEASPLLPRRGVPIYRDGVVSLDELDKLVLDSGFSCQAKWSRERQEFSLSSHQLAPYRSLRLVPGSPYPPLTVSIDKNAAKLSNNISLAREAGEGGRRRGSPKSQGDFGVTRPGEGEPATINVSIDKNAGYGYLAEFEMVIDDESKADEAKSFIRSVMHQLEVDELPQDRLQRMFDYYNQNWREYYGTNKVFIIE